MTRWRTLQTKKVLRSLPTSFALLERRPDETVAHETDYESPSREELLREALAQPTETRNQRDAREIEEQDARWAAERDGPGRRGGRPHDSSEQHNGSRPRRRKWDAWLKAHIANAFAEHDDVRLEVHAEIIAQQRKELLAEVAKLRADFELKLDALEPRLPSSAPSTPRSSWICRRCHYGGPLNEPRQAPT